MKCYECHAAELRTESIDYFYRGICLGKIPTDVCPRCGVQFLDEKAARMIERAAKKAGVWGRTR